MSGDSFSITITEPDHAVHWRSECICGRIITACPCPDAKIASRVIHSPCQHGISTVPARTPWRCLCGQVYAPHVDSCPTCSTAANFPFAPQVVPFVPPFRTTFGDCVAPLTFSGSTKTAAPNPSILDEWRTGKIVAHDVDLDYEAD